MTPSRAPLAELERAVASGAVTTVSAERGFHDPAATGWGVQEVRWRDGRQLT